MLLALLAILVVMRQGTVWFQSARNPHGPGDAALISSGGFTAGECEISSVLDGRTLLVRQTHRESPSGSGLPLEEKQIPPTAVESDTLKSFTGRLRLIGLPETASKNSQAELLLNELAGGKKGKLKLDRRRVDRDGCLVGYVEVEEKSLAVAILEQGICKLETYPGDSAQQEKELKQAVQEAKLNKRGIWAESK